jgi:GNAT superfamily N-acetyltransferase
VEYRRITPADIEPVAAFAVDGMRPHLYPGVRVSDEKVAAIVRHFQGSWSDFHLVAFDDGKPAGIVAAAVVESPFFERAEAHVVALRTVAAGAGPRLLQALRTWADRETRVRRVLFHCEFDAPAAMRRLLRRYGFTHQGVTCTYYKD